MADERHDLHKEHPTSRPLSDGYEEVGLAGEVAFGQFCGLCPDFELKPKGDNGVDFTVAIKMTVDVKTARKAGNLIHEEGKGFADIYVLAEFSDETRKALLVGWELGRVLKAAPVKDFGYGVLNHYIPRAQLRSMETLGSRLAAIKFGVLSA